MKVSSTIAVIAQLMILALLIAGCAQDKAAQKEPLQVGAVIALTGSQAPFGQQVREGADIAVKEINDAGGVGGRPLVLTYEDSKGEGAAGISAYRKLHDTQGIKAFIVISSSVTLALEPISAQDNVIQMDVGSTTPLYRKENDTSFRISTTAPQLAGGVAGLLKERNITRVAALYVNNDYGAAMIRAFQERYNGTIVFQEGYAPDSSDFLTEIQKIKEARPQAIVIMGNFDKTGLILKDMAAAKASIPVYGDMYSIEGKQVIDVAGKAAEGVRFISPVWSENTSSSAQRFAAEYRRRYGKDPVVLSAQAYDGVWAIARAYQSCDDAQCATQRLINASWDGATGEIRFDRTGDVERDPEFIVKTVKDGKFVRETE
jgi:branched-chain amino acid transport system substrate-binding protein